VSLGVEQEAGVVHVGADEDEAADHDEPHVGQDAAGDGKDEADDLPEAGGGAGAFEDAVRAGELTAEDAAGVERCSGWWGERGEQEIGPDGGTKQMSRCKPGALEKAYFGGDGQDDGAEDEAKEEVCDWTDEAKTLANLRSGGTVGRFRGGVLLQAAGGEQK